MLLLLLLTGMSLTASKREKYFRGGPQNHMRAEEHTPLAIRFPSPRPGDPRDWRCPEQDQDDDDVFAKMFMYVVL